MAAARSAPDPPLFYDSIADRFDSLDHPADLERRLSLVFDDLLADVALAAGRVLDAGCGYGPFSKAAADRGASPVSCDIGLRLVRRATAGSPGRGVVGDVCQLPFADGTFAVVISSEVVEHVVEPARALRELVRVLAPGGWLVVTTPNRAWQPVVRLASKLSLRPFQGLENFTHWHEVEAVLRDAGAEIVSHRGFHPLPFQLGMAGLNRSLERRLGESGLARLMVNQAILCRKPGSTASGQVLGHVGAAADSH